MKKWLKYLRTILGYLCFYLAISYLVDWSRPYLPDFHSPLPPVTELVFFATIAAVAIITYHFGRWAIAYFRKPRD